MPPMSPEAAPPPIHPPTRHADRAVNPWIREETLPRGLAPRD